MAMVVSVEFVGALHTLAKVKNYSVELEEGATVSSLMQRLRAELFRGEEFFDASNLLIIKNGREISALKGIQTELKHEDKVAFIPISHGG